MQFLSWRGLKFLILDNKKSSARERKTAIFVGMKLAFGNASYGDQKGKA